MKSKKASAKLTEVDFSKGVRGLHHIPASSRTYMPVSIEREVWEYFSRKAEDRGIDLSQLLTEVLKHNIEISESLRSGSRTSGE